MKLTDSRPEAREPMTEERLEELLEVLLAAVGYMDRDDREAADVEDTAPLEGVRVRTYHDGQVLSRNRGLELRFPDGAEFQLTIVQSRLPREDGGKGERGKGSHE